MDTSHEIYILFIGYSPQHDDLVTLDYYEQGRKKLHLAAHL